MTDESIDQELSALIDGELTAERAAELNARVASDPELKARLSTLEAVNESLRSLTPPAMPADLRARLQTRIEGDPEATTQPISSETSMGWGKPLAAALAAGFIAAWLLLPASSPDNTTKTTTNIDAIDDIEPMLEEASDHELAIAFELEALRDLDVIQDLDLLEALLAMEDAEAQTHNDEERG